jgi:hypothetical protein
MKKENINKRLLTEIEKIDAPENLKKFLEELLMEENSGVCSHSYKDQYKKVINNYIHQPK